MAEHYQSHRFENGLQLLVETVPDVRSAACVLLLPAGTAYDTPDQAGLANLLTELAPRGAGDRSYRELAVAFDNLGVQRFESAEIQHSAYGMTMLAEKLPTAFELFADVVLRPQLTQEQLENSQSTILQEIEAIEDDPAQKLFIELRRRALPPPLGQPTLGTAESIEGLTVEAARRFHERCYRPEGAILGIAGAVEFAAVRDLVARRLGDWKSRAQSKLEIGAAPGGHGHIKGDKVQTHLGISFPSVNYSDPDFFNAHGAIGVLGGGMSSRLFSEVREKRGLCYSVSASYHPLRDLGFVLCYAGTTNERAAETATVMMAELRRLADGVAEDEVQRVRAGLKASLVISEESTTSRAGVLARSWYNLGRVRSLEEVAAEVDKITPEGIVGFLERHPPRDFTSVTYGPQPLEIAS
ncbi:MAG TPA: pitrilysin family protein [Planctomycetia bacterium]|nr:pitrilysin family protein [Planctomycetia bacterium]